MTPTPTPAFEEQDVPTIVRIHDPLARVCCDECEGADGTDCRVGACDDAPCCWCDYHTFNCPKFYTWCSIFVNNAEDVHRNPHNTEVLRLFSPQAERATRRERRRRALARVFGGGGRTLNP